jgi:putative flippase GtrA
MISVMFSRASRRQAAQFLLVSLSALLLNTSLVLVLSAAFAPFLAPASASLLAKLSATGAGLAWNFLGNHFWTFRTTA